MRLIASKLCLCFSEIPSIKDQADRGILYVFINEGNIKHGLLRRFMAIVEGKKIPHDRRLNVGDDNDKKIVNLII
jgi:hypothetical protein